MRIFCDLCKREMPKSETQYNINVFERRGGEHKDKYPLFVLNYCTKCFNELYE